MDTRILNADNVLLAALSGETVLVVVVKEGVQTTTKDVDIGRVHHTETPSTSTVGGGTIAAGREVGIKVALIDGEGSGSIGVTLHVSSLSLDNGHPHVAGIGDLVVVHLRVLRGSSPEPDGVLRLEKDTTAVVDVNLRVVLEVKLVVGNPEPTVLDVDGSSLGGVEQEESTLAVSVGLVGAVGVLGTSVGLQSGTSRATNAEVDIPETGGTSRRSSEVPLHHDGTRSSTLGLDDQVGELDIANIASLTNLEDGLGVGLVVEGSAVSHEKRPHLTDNLDLLVGRNLDSVGDDVGTVIKEDDLSSAGVVKETLNGSSVISGTVTLATRCLCADEAALVKALVLGLGAGEDIAVIGQETSRLGDATLGSLNSLAFTSVVGATLSVASNHGTTCDEGRVVTSVADGSVNTSAEVNIVQDHGVVGHGEVGLVQGVDTNGSVGDDTVEEQERAGSDGADATSRHINTNLSIVDGNLLHGPKPAPVEVDGRVAAVEGQVAGGELLVTKEGTVATTVEDEISHETTRAVVHEDTLLSVGSARVGVHVEDNVLKTSGLSNLPVDTSASLGTQVGDVNDEVANLTEKVVLVGVPVGTVILVRVRVDDSHADKAGSGLEGGNINGITNKLSVISLHNGLADHVSTGREVDEGRLGSLRVTAETATRAVGDSRVDGIGVISRSVTLGTIVHHVAEDLVGAVVSKDGSLATSHVGQPVAAVSASLQSTGGGGGCSRSNDPHGQERGREELRKAHLDD